MKIPLIIACAVLPLSAFAADPAPAPAANETPADKDFAVFREVMSEKPAVTSKDNGKKAVYAWFDAHNQKVTTAAVAFYSTHPADPRRWDVVLAMVNMPPYFIQS